MLDVADQRTGWIGEPLRRREDDRLVRGVGTFVDDLEPPGCAHLVFVRSPVAAGTLTELDLEAARAAPGVVAILTGEDLRDLPGLSVNALIADIAVPNVPLLARERVEAVGQPIAAVIAETAAAARDAADLVAPLVASRDPEAGRAPAFAQSWASGDVETAFAEARHVVAVTIAHSRLAPAPMEPRAALATLAADGTLTAWLSTQTPHRARAEIARILRLPVERVRVIAPDVGGAFGGKASLYPEDVVVAAAAHRLARPVKWCASRSEDFLSATHGRAGLSEGELAVSAAGDFLAVRARFRFPLGYWLPFSAAAPARNAARIVPGPYRVASVEVSARGTPGHDAPMNIYRGAGRPEAAMLLERLADGAARRLGADPLEVRRRNVVRDGAFPHRIASGEVLDSGCYETLLDRAGAVAGYPALLRERERRRAAGEICGVGVALYVEPCGAGWESARVGLDPEGRIVATTGSSNQGQGRSTTYAQIVADVLAIAPPEVTVLHGDTATSPDGIGALASRSTAVGGTAMLQAAEAFRERVRGIAARILQAPVDAVGLDGAGAFQRDEPGRRAGWGALAEASPERIEATARFETPGEAWSSGCCIAAVSIDGDTGEPTIERVVWVDDAGAIVNPLLVEGQLRGGLAQGLGEALMERLIYTPEGELVTGSLMDYALPRASDIPPVELASLATPSPMNGLGAKGVGEAGCIGVPAALVNAVVDALSPFGLDHLDMPLTSATIWRAMRAAKEERSP